MSLRLGAMTAVAGSAWIAVLGLAAVPVYLQRLGLEAYGVIGFFVTLQTVLQVLDLGLAPAVNREMARSKSLNDAEHARTLLRTLEKVYWLVGLAIAVLALVLANPVATLWLRNASLPDDELARALVLMGCVIAARWPIAVYQNTLIGLGHLVRASGVGAAMATVSVGASVICVVQVEASLTALFLTQTTVALLHVLVVRLLAWQALGGRGASAFDLRCVQRIWRFTVGMGGVAVSGLALTQLDKALLSRLLPLASFGEYMLAATVVGGLLVVVAPVFNVIFPRFSALVASQQDGELRRLYEDGSRLFAITYVPITIALGVYAEDILQLWTGNAAMASRVAPMVLLLCIGSAINGLMYFPYSLQLAFGRSRIPLIINTSLLVVLAPLIWVLTHRYGGTGGAAAWAILEVLYLLVGTWATHRFVGVVDGPRWLVRSVILPVLACVAAAAISHPLVALFAPGSAGKIVAIAISVLASQLACALVFPDLRSRLLARLRQTPLPAHPA